MSAGNLQRVPTVGEGDCAFHSIFGNTVVYSRSGPRLMCSDVSNKRKFVGEKVRNAPANSDLHKAILESIRMRILDEMPFGETSAQIMEEDKQGTAARLKAKNAVVQYFQNSIGSNLKWSEIEAAQGGKAAFVSNWLRSPEGQAALESDNVLKKLVEKDHKLRSATDKVTEEVANRAAILIKEYADRLETDGEWLFRCEISVIAFAADYVVTVCTPRVPAPVNSVSLDAKYYQETANEAANTRITILFNGRDHYERMLSSTDWEKLKTESSSNKATNPIKNEKSNSDEDSDSEVSDPESDSHIDESDSKIDPDDCINSDELNVFPEGFDKDWPQFTKFLEDRVLGRSTKQQSAELRAASGEKLEEAFLKELKQLIAQLEASEDFQQAKINLKKKTKQKKKTKHPKTPSPMDRLKSYLTFKQATGFSGALKLELQVRALAIFHNITLITKSKFARNDKRDASAGIAGFVFQAQQSVQRWLSLASNELLVCEGVEDIDVVAVRDAVKLVEKCSATLSRRAIASIVHGQAKHSQLENGKNGIHLRMTEHTVRKCIGQCISNMRRESMPFQYLFLCRAHNPKVESHGLFKTKEKSAIMEWKRIAEILKNRDLEEADIANAISDDDKRALAEIWTYCNEICSWCQTRDDIGVPRETLGPIHELSEFVKLLLSFGWEIDAADMTERKKEIMKSINTRIISIGCDLPIGDPDLVLSSIYASLATYVLQDVLSVPFDERPSLTRDLLDRMLSVFCQNQVWQVKGNAVWDILNDSIENPDEMSPEEFEQTSKDLREYLLGIIQQIQSDPRPVPSHFNFARGRLSSWETHLLNGEDLTHRGMQELLSLHAAWLQAE